jgi:hypothetical protein
MAFGAVPYFLFCLATAALLSLSGTVDDPRWQQQPWAAQPLSVAVGVKVI